MNERNIIHLEGKSGNNYRFTKYHANELPSLWEVAEKPVAGVLIFSKIVDKEVYNLLTIIHLRVEDDPASIIKKRNDFNATHFFFDYYYSEEKRTRIIEDIEDSVVFKR
jgi:hypothetical protein